MANALLDAALRYADDGWQVFPLYGITNGRCDCGTKCDSPGKHPRVAWTQEATTDQERIERWWTEWPNANIGVATGKRSGIYVIDIDNKASVEVSPGVLVGAGDNSIRQQELVLGGLNPTLTVTTGSGGTHLIYDYPEDMTDPLPNRSGMLHSVDTRGDGGYIVAAPSTHVSGNRYRVLEDGVSPERLSERWLAFVRESRSNLGKGTELEFPEDFAITAGEGRHDWLFKIGSRLRGQHGLPFVALYGALAAYNRQVCVPPLSAMDVEHITESCMKYDPEYHLGVDTSDAPLLVEGDDLADLLYDFMMEAPPAFIPLVEGMLNSGECMIVGGPPNVGKTWMLMDMMVSIATGGLFLGKFQSAPQTVLFIDEEGSLRGDWERFHLLLAGRDGLSASGVPLYAKIDSGIRLDDERGLAALSRLLERYRPGAVFLDSLVRVHGGSESDNRAMASFFQRVKKLMVTYGSSFIFTHHVRKPGKDAEEDPIWMLRGASDIQGFPDTVLIDLPTKNHDETKVIHTKMRNGPKLDSFLMRRVIDRESAKLGVVLTEEQQMEELGGDTAKIVQAISESRTGFTSAEHLAVVTGLSLDTVTRLAGAATSAGYLNSHKRGGNWMYQIPLGRDATS